MVLLSPGSAAFAPLWEEHQESKLTSCCCSTLIALLFFIAVVNVLLHLTNELNSESHADREKNMACVVWGTWCFRLGISPCKMREWLRVLSASGPSLLPTNPNSHSPRLAGSRELSHWFLSLDIIPHPWKNWLLPGWNLFPSYGLSSTQRLPTESYKQHSVHIFDKHVFSELGSTAVTNLPLCLDAPTLTL